MKILFNGKSGTQWRLKEQTHFEGHQLTRPAFIIAYVWNFWDPFVNRQRSPGESFIEMNVSYTAPETPASKRKHDELPMAGIALNRDFLRSTQLCIMQKSPGR